MLEEVSTIVQLEARLPELEWKLAQLAVHLSARSISSGIFQQRFQMTPQTCIQEIKADLTALKIQMNGQRAEFLVDRVSRKINTLVKLCQMSRPKQKIEPRENFNVKTMSTRQQWIKSIQCDIIKLAEQKQSLASRLSQLDAKNTEVALTIQGELGEVERRLTLAQERLNRTVQWTVRRDIYS